MSGYIVIIYQSKVLEKENLMSISRTLSAQINSYFKGMKVGVNYHMFTSTTSSELSVIQKKLRKKYLSKDFLPFSLSNRKRKFEFAFKPTLEVS
jgi:hypothetical protein